MGNVSNHYHGEPRHERLCCDAANSVWGLDKARCGFQRMLVLTIAVSGILTGCTGTPVADPLATAVLADIQPPLECPEPEPALPPADLLTPVDLQAPTILPAGQGDYGVSRAGLELLIDGYRALHERLARWRAWAE